MRIVYYPSDNSGCGNYRCILPAEIINANKLAEVKTSFQVSTELMEWGDVFVWQRQYKPQLLSTVKEYPHKKHIFELDDDLFNITPDNPSYKAYQSTSIRKNLIEFIKTCDYVTCSTEPLREILSKYNKNAVALNNCVLSNYSVEPKLKTVDEEVRIGWTGSAHHHDDLKHVLHPLEEICNKYPNVKIIWMGWLPDYIKAKLASDRFEFHEWEKFNNYYPKLQEINLDIGLAPLDDVAFNKSKSNLRYLELGLIGACTVASDIYPYSSTITSGVDGLIVKKNRTKEWVSAISSLIEDPNKRYNMAKNAQSKVLREFDYYKNINKWMQLYSHVNSLPKGEKKPVCSTKQRECTVVNNIPITLERHTPFDDAAKIDVERAKKLKANKVKSILAVKLDHIGDFILSIPAFTLLKQRFPKAKITALVSPLNKALAEKVSAIDEIITYEFFNEVSEKGHKNDDNSPEFMGLMRELNNKKFDLAIDLRRHGQTRKFVLCSGAKHIRGYLTYNQQMDDHLSTAVVPPQELGAKKAPHITQQMCRLVNAVVRNNSNHVPKLTMKCDEKTDEEMYTKYSHIFESEGNVIGINPGVGTAVRQWPNDKYVDLINLYTSNNLDDKIILFGAGSEVALATDIYNKIDNKDRIEFLVGKLSINEFISTVKNCDLFIGNNSGSGHLAAAANIPTLIVFSGQVIPQQWNPLGDKSMLIRADISCAPCYVGFKKDCRYNLDCLTHIEAQAVYDTSNKLLEYSDEVLTIEKLVGDK